jgi:DNA-binding MarR family transcriptional regulator
MEENMSCTEDISEPREMSHTLPMASDGNDLVDDDRITLWGLFLEAHHLIGASLWADLEVAFPYPESWFEVLLRLSRSPGGAQPMTRLAGMVMFSSGGFTKLADRMEAEGLIKRVPCPDDRRSSLATITPKGRRILERGLRTHLPSLDRHLLANLDDEQRDQLERILRVLRDGACGADVVAGDGATLIDPAH